MVRLYRLIWFWFGFSVIMLTPSEHTKKVRVNYMNGPYGLGNLCVWSLTYFFNSEGPCCLFLLRAWFLLFVFVTRLVPVLPKKIILTLIF